MLVMLEKKIDFLCAVKHYIHVVEYPLLEPLTRDLLGENNRTNICSRVYCFPGFKAGC